MNVKRPMAMTIGSLRHDASWTDLSPSQAGLAAALRRAFEAPADENSRKYDELLSRLR